MSSSASLIALALAVTAPGTAANPLASFSKVTSNRHDALLSPPQKETKWLVFPQQQELHAQSVEVGSLRATHEKVSSDTFFKEHTATLGLDQEAVFTRKRQYDTNSITHEKYQQSVNSIPVFGGDFHLTVGSHDGVLSAHGLPLKVINMADHDVAKAQLLNEKGVSLAVEADLLALAKAHILSTVNKAAKVPLLIPGDMTVSSPTQVVWSRTGKATAEGTPAVLTYHLDAVTADPYASYDVFIDISTHKVVLFTDKTKRASPFTSPIATDIDVYDLYLKDYNDDRADDDYYNLDPDRMGAATKVFDTDSNTYTFPTTNTEINNLVDYTLYAANLFNSLSNTQLPSWNTALPFNIEFNLTIPNAYFDGTWGIHFGTGYITDDVVVHEWAHAYTQVLADLYYEGESGALNEAFSDIYGEAVDLLVAEGSVREGDLRATWPLQCHDHVGVDGVSPAGTDKGYRWALGENVTAGSSPGQLRDMYYPECHASPGTVYSQYYVCSEYDYDGSGVHSNSGVLNRIFATLTDGGEYEDQSGGSNLVVTALGLTKTLNLFYQAEASLTQYSQFYDAATALSLTCSNLIGQDLYTPNVLDSSVVVSSEKITSADCASVTKALTGSGLSSTTTHCPNLECQFDTYGCVFSSCDGVSVSNEVSSSMNDYWDPPCKGGSYPATGTAKYARVFEQSDIGSSSFVLDCIRFGYFNEGLVNATFELFIDANGGTPDADADMTSLGSFPTIIYNTGGNQYSTGLASTPVAVRLSGAETLVVVMSHALTDSPEVFYPAGYYQNHTGSDRTFVGGSCITGYQAYSSNWLLELSSVSGNDDDTCFHVDTKIDYKGVEYTYEELKAGKESECTVPHSPSSKGVVISTSCDKTVRVTDTHLMATTKGFQLAYSLKAGDVLFGDYGNNMCTVKSVEKEKTTQQYFGLNCVHSEVLASGLRASTFGDFHTLPSWYMTYVGGLVGTEAASHLGEYIAEWYFQK